MLGLERIKTRLLGLTRQALAPVVVLGALGLGREALDPAARLGQAPLPDLDLGQDLLEGEVPVPGGLLRLGLRRGPFDQHPGRGPLRAALGLADHQAGQVHAAPQEIDLIEVGQQRLGGQEVGGEVLGVRDGQVRDTEDPLAQVEGDAAEVDRGAVELLESSLHAVPRPRLDQGGAGEVPADEDDQDERGAPDPDRVADLLLELLLPALLALAAEEEPDEQARPLGACELLPLLRALGDRGHLRPEATHAAGGEEPEPQTHDEAEQLATSDDVEAQAAPRKDRGVHDRGRQTLGRSLEQEQTDLVGHGDQQPRHDAHHGGHHERQGEVRVDDEQQSDEQSVEPRRLQQRWAEPEQAAEDAGGDELERRGLAPQDRADLPCDHVVLPPSPSAPRRERGVSFRAGGGSSAGAADIPSTHQDHLRFQNSHPAQRSASQARLAWTQFARWAPARAMQNQMRSASARVICSVQPRS